VAGGTLLQTGRQEGRLAHGQGVPLMMWESEWMTSAARCLLLVEHGSTKFELSEL
jgi:hypothetical protein